ncbi:MAG: neutral/alkaline non-lysosomal ceramidase N-terminal domain-containing protein [Verrucomicrobiales bacterium]
MILSKLIPVLLLAVAGVAAVGSGVRPKGKAAPAGAEDGGGAVRAVVAAGPAGGVFRAGAHQVDIGPPAFPVRVNGGFTERSGDRVVDALWAKALALDDGTTRLAICVVDTCMMDRALIDDAKAEAARLTGLPTDRMLVSATHTHSAPSAMGCLGSRADPGYVAYLPGKIAEAIAGAVGKLEPAKIGWGVVDAWDHTFNRRWIRRPDRMLNDPFGQPTVRAMMHPGHQSADVTGPSGPVDPALSLMAVQSRDGKPLAVLANYSMHYIGSDLLSSDYFGRFAGHLASKLGADAAFVGMMSQGTSGDLWAGDYGAPARPLPYDTYAQGMAEMAAGVMRRLEWRESVPLRMAERTLALQYRVPDAERLAWARQVVAGIGDRLPQSQPEIYAAEAIHLHDRQRTELKLQAVKIGDLGLTALPNEVVAITGLKLKARSPFPITMNIELANGAEGYIPPPEQHRLGGYITWPARTAGLEEEAEPRIVETVLGLLEEVSGQPRRSIVVENGPYAEAVLASDPVAYWRLDDITWPVARDARPEARHATMEPGVAVYLPGAGSGTGISPNAALTASRFSGAQINRAVHMAGGRLRAPVELGDQFSVEMWIWNGLPAEARAVTGYLFSRGPDEDRLARGEHLGIGGTHRADITGRLFVFSGNERDHVVAGRTVLAPKAWHHVVFVREGRRVRVHLDGRGEPEIDAEFDHTLPGGSPVVYVGGRTDGLFSFEGKLDEVAVYAKALGAAEIEAHYRASGVAPPVTAVVAVPDVVPPLDPKQSLAKLHVADGYGVELVAAEPLTVDPVAIDWDAAGRLWVAEMADYPLGLDGKGEPGGRIRVLEDINGDGRYDTSRLFAEGLNFPTGLLTWRGGVLVTVAPDIVFLRDADGDGRADTREVVISGLLEGNQQLRANGLRWGLDNWVYCAAGGHHGEYGVGNKLRSVRAGLEVAVGSRDFRFRPDTGELEAESGPSQFGRNRDDWGRWFGTQNSRPLWHYVLADRYLRRNPHSPAPDPTRQVVVPLNPKVWPVSPQEKRYHSFEQGGHFTSACDGMIYRDSVLFPADEMHAFTCEPFHNVVQRNILVDEGVSFSFRRAEGEERRDFLASEDRWFRPVMTRTGPDGALWIVDMYRYMIEHPDWLPPEGRAELLPHYRLGDDRGRIYRVFRSGATLSGPSRLDELDPRQLVSALDTSNGWQRDKVHQMLLWRGGHDMAGPLHELVKMSGNPRVRVQALCVLEGLGVLTPSTVLAALGDPHPGVRENALRLAEPRGNPDVVAGATTLVGDASAKVRLQLALALGEWTSPEAGAALGRLAVADAAEPFIVAAVLSSATAHCRAVAEAVVEAGGRAYATFSRSLAGLALALNDREALASLMATAVVPDAEASFKEDQFTMVGDLLQLVARPGQSWEALAKGDDSLAQRLKAIPAIVEAARRVASDESAPVSRRVAAASLLTRWPNDREITLQTLADWLAPRHPSELQHAGIQSLATTGDASVPQRLLAGWSSHSPAVREVVVDALLTREEWCLVLLADSLGGGPLALDAARQSRLLQNRSAAVRDAAAKRLAPTAARADVLARFQPALSLAGDTVRGRAVYERLCASCHKQGDVGQDVGPNLQSVASHPPEKLLTNILAPNADVQPGYFAYVCRLTDGAEIYGLLAAETGNSLTFKLSDGTSRTVLRREIAALQSTSLSLMPEGLEAGLSLQEMADLIGFLKEGSVGVTAREAAADDGALRVGAAAVNLRADASMPLAGYLEARFTDEQEGELRATAVVVEQTGGTAVALVSCDVLWVTREITDPALAEIERTTGLRPDNVLINATHTHHAPGTAPAHAFGWSEAFAREVRRGIVRAVQTAYARRAPARFWFKVGEERTVGANSRLRLPDYNISWLNPMAEAGWRVEPTGPFDPELPVLDFRDPRGRSIAVLYNHSTHTIGTRSGRDVRSPSFYGLAAQEMESTLGAVVGFIEGASGSTHNIRGVPVAVAVDRMIAAVSATRAAAEPVPVAKIVAAREPFHFVVRSFDERAEDAHILRYVQAHAPQNGDRIREIFADQRRVLDQHQGTRRTTWIQVIRLGDVAIVGVPAEFFTSLGLGIKKRSPFRHTLIAELSNDWIGYLPDAAGYKLGGYQTWTGLHSYAEPGTGERLVQEALRLLHAAAR